MKTYAGIGSRETPESVLDHMHDIAAHLRSKEYTLRTGGAHGADRAFELGANDGYELYLPWQGYNGAFGHVVTPEAIEFSSKFHPNWNACSRGARALHGRNAHIILGPKLDDPVEFVLCWTPGGLGGGGTGQGIRIARARSIKVFDFGHTPTLERVLAHIANHRR